MSDAGDDCELIPPDTLLIPFSYVRVSQPADWVLQVG
jgi:hypothetical protein